ncbi:hypothetical protein CHS0354_015021 [Potamilus streckersoni]|uniref:Ig-like domain-containing protein n=1 Tax=Potamilus streckersoni TaxID=2493646 RepID=A0AAE0SML3_9BIVA|nr:hypothetical protein CHS0354_015021 [Potamilus streckersoni]
MMACALCWYFLLLHSLGVSSERKLHASRGERVQLFADIAVDKHKKISLYVYSKLITEWLSENSSIIYIRQEYERKIYMDYDSSIWIFCVGPNDTANYSIKYNSFETGPKVELIVLDHLTQGDQVQMCLDNADCMKTYLGNLTWKKFQQLMDLHPEFVKAHCDDSELIGMGIKMFRIEVVVVLILCLAIALKFRRNIFRLISLGKRRIDMFRHSFTRNSNGTDCSVNSVPLSVRISDGSSLTATEGESVTLTCVATGSGTIDVEWIGPSYAHLNSNMKYSVTAYNSYTKQSTLKINNLIRGDAGKYICRGLMGTETKEDSTHLTVTGSVRNRWRRGGRLVTYALRWPHSTGSHLDQTPVETERLLPDQDSPLSDYAPFEFAENNDHRS